MYLGLLFSTPPRPKAAMFLSWKPSSEGGWPTLTKLPVCFDPVTAKKTGLQACANCRARKVKCIWVVGGCERCKSTGRECIYEATTASAAKSARRRSKVASSTGAGRGTGLKITATAEETSAAPSDGAWPSSHTSHDTAMSGSTSTPTSQEAATATGESSKMHSPIETPMPDMAFFGGNLAAVDPWDAVDPWEADAWVSASLHVSPVAGSASMSTTLGTAAASSTTNPGAGTMTKPRRVPPDDSDVAQCRCLRRLVVLVDEIESIVDGHGLTPLDGAMAAHKEALGRGAAMLQCAACTGRFENMMILSLLVDKLVRVCRRVAEACAAGLGGESSSSASSSSGGDSKTAPDAAPRLSLRGRGGTGPDTPVPPGRHGPDGRVYSVDAPDEYLFVVAGLLRFQLLQLFDLTQQLRQVAACAASDPMSRRLGACGEAVRDMLREAGLAPAEENDVPSI
ncbi:hypothetical protein QBC46DRAFT_325213 [Diplogelasinospora grovesii]|uniref:Zn(2)-C6 fungal-type domain-containing protein n=1 Tax=Diplogelasinospora grovesii TaxID=303347 RepID=A0AAN6RZ08_9PEZI|nr:hypothetical protein QBC46DRAFT_325213 [Diplogelasinospora grovesii]